MKRVNIKFQGLNLEVSGNYYTDDPDVFEIEAIYYESRISGLIIRMDVTILFEAFNQEFINDIKNKNQMDLFMQIEQLCCEKL